MSGEFLNPFSKFKGHGAQQGARSFDIKQSVENMVHRERATIVRQMTKQMNKIMLNVGNDLHRDSEKRRGGMTDWVRFLWAFVGDTVMTIGPLSLFSTGNSSKYIIYL